MDRSLLIAQLIQIEAHVAANRKHLERQRSIVGQLEAEGADTTAAQLLLDHMRKMQRIHMANRDRIRAALDDPDLRHSTQDASRP